MSGTHDNPHFSNNRGDLSWHAWFSVPSRRASTSPWVPCEKRNAKGVQCTNPDGMGHERGNLKTPHIFPVST